MSQNQNITKILGGGSWPPIISSLGLEEQLQKSRHDKYISALTEIRGRIVSCESNRKMDAYSTAYFNIINHGKENKILTHGEHNLLVLELGKAQLSYIDKLKK